MQAAAGRVQTQTLMGGGPRRLGGTSVSLPPAQALHGSQQHGMEACCADMCTNRGMQSFGFTDCMFAALHAIIDCAIPCKHEFVHTASFSYVRCRHSVSSANLGCVQ